MNNNYNTLILIVDDNPHNLQVLGSILEKNDFETAVALNGQQALEFVETEKPDLILLDIMMPDMDGYEVCRRLKMNHDSKRIPVIFLTALPDTKDIVHGFEAGAVDYITKPFNHAELLARIRTHVELKKARDEIETLRGIIPICASCKKIKDDKGYWIQIEKYIEAHSDALFSHGLCNECAERLYGNEEWYKKSKGEV